MSDHSEFSNCVSLSTRCPSRCPETQLCKELGNSDTTGSAHHTPQNGMDLVCSPHSSPSTPPLCLTGQEQSISFSKEAQFKWEQTCAWGCQILLGEPVFASKRFHLTFYLPDKRVVISGSNCKQYIHRFLGFGKKTLWNHLTHGPSPYVELKDRRIFIVLRLRDWAEIQIAPWCNSGFLKPLLVGIRAARTTLLLLPTETEQPFPVWLKPVTSLTSHSGHSCCSCNPWREPMLCITVEPSVQWLQNYLQKLRRRRMRIK